jgi:hypothetical protein
MFMVYTRSCWTHMLVCSHVRLLGWIGLASTCIGSWCVFVVIYNLMYKTRQGLFLSI